VIALGGSVGHGRDPLHVSDAPVDPQVSDRAVSEALQKAGVAVLLHSMADGVHMAEETDISHIRIENKAGRWAVAGRWFSGATGGGDVAFWAGARWEKGDAHGKMQPATLRFRMGGVSVDKVRLAIAADPDRYGSDLIPAEHFAAADNFIVVG